MTFEQIAFSFLQIITLIYVFTILIVYSRKKKIMTIENYIFTVMLIIVFVSVCIDIISVIVPYTLHNDTLTILVNRFYTLSLDYWLLTYIMYILVATSKKNQGVVPFKDNKEKKYFEKTIFRMLIIAAIATILNFTLSMDIVKDQYWIVEGWATYLSYLIAFEGLLVIFYKLIETRGKIPKRTSVAIFAFAITTALGIAVQLILLPLFIVSSLTGFITVLLYFTLENPDLNMIEEINIAVKSAERAKEAKTEFLTNMSTEIKTPLNAIFGFSRALKDEKLSPSAQEEVNQILISSNNLMEIVNDILDISKIESGKIEFAEINYDSVKFFEEIAEKAEHMLAKKPIKFKVEIDNKLPTVLCGDIYRVDQIIMNLLSNSIKYTNEGTISFIVSGETLNDHCNLTIIVDDTGKGISKENLGKLFTNFQKLEPVETESTLGTGLGLSITKSLVELMNGTIKVESEIGKGTKFTVEIVQQIVNKDLSEINSEEYTDYKPFSAENCRVIVVDDNVINLKVAKRLLKDYNLEPELITNGEELITRIENGNKYDLIFLDEVMPKITGSEILKILKEKSDFNTPIVALTANQEEGAKESFIQSGFNNYLAKPIVKEQLYIIMKQYLIPKEESYTEDDDNIATFEL